MSVSPCCRQVTIRLCACPSRNSDEETTAHADGLLVASGKTVVVSRFEEPAKTVFAGRPEHEVSRKLSCNGIGHFPILPEMDPFGSDAQHELCLPRYGPRLLEEQVSIPFC